jgi:hypothetical protein
MKQKPTNLSEFLRTVTCVQHPDLEPVHRLLLITLAQFANYTTGRGAYPGSDFLEKAMGRSWDRINVYAKHVERCGLLVRTQVGRKGRNTEWNFCLDNSAYPDIGPQEGTDQSDAIGPHNSETLGPHNSSVLGPQISETLGPHRSAVPTNPPTNTTTTPTTGSGVVLKNPSATVESRSASLTKEQLRAAKLRVLEVFIREENETPVTTAGQDEELNRLIRKHGGDKVAAALKLDLRDPAYYTNKSGERTRLPLSRFLKRFDLLLKQAAILEERKSKPEDEALVYRVARIKHGITFPRIPLTVQQKQFLEDISFQSSEEELSLAEQIIAARGQDSEPSAEEFF